MTDNFDVSNRRISVILIYKVSRGPDTDGIFWYHKNLGSLDAIRRDHRELAAAKANNTRGEERESP